MSSAIDLSQHRTCSLDQARLADADLVLGFEFDSRYRPCSLAGQIPRLRHLCA